MNSNKIRAIEECRGMRVRTLNRTLLQYELEIWKEVEHDLDIVALRNQVNTISIFNILDTKREVLYHIVVDEDTGEVIEFKRLTE